MAQTSRCETGHGAAPGLRVQPHWWRHVQPAAVHRRHRWEHRVVGGSSTTSSSCSSTTSSSTPLAPAGAATSCSGDGDVLPTVKVGWPAARAVGRGCAAGALDFYYYSIPGGRSGLYGRSPCAAGSELAAAPGAGCAGSSSEDCDTAPLLQEPVHSLAPCPRPGWCACSTSATSSALLLDDGAPPCSAALAPHWAPPLGL